MSDISVFIIPSVHMFNGLNEDDKKLRAMCGVGSLDDTKIYSQTSRQVLFTPEAIKKYKLDYNRDFNSLIGKQAYVIRRQRDNINNPINNKHKAYMITIIEFKNTHMYRTCYVKCKFEDNKIVNIMVECLFVKPLVK